MTRTWSVGRVDALGDGVDLAGGGVGSFGAGAGGGAYVVAGVVADASVGDGFAHQHAQQRHDAGDGAVGQAGVQVFDEAL